MILCSLNMNRYEFHGLILQTDLESIFQCVCDRLDVSWLTCLASTSKFCSCTPCSSLCLLDSAMVSRSSSRSLRYSMSAWILDWASHWRSAINWIPLDSNIYTEKKTLGWVLSWTQLTLPTIVWSYFKLQNNT